jgi:YesN/AraC family two-component response regulator
VTGSWEQSFAPGPAQAASATEPSWQEALEALERLDVEGFRRRVDRLVGHLTAEHDRPRSRSEVAIRLYDLLRTTADQLYPRTGQVDDPRRLRWIRTLASRESVPGIVEAFREELSRLLDEVTDARSRVNPIALQARRFIEEHAHEPVSLARVAAELGVARNYLSSLFRREFDRTLTDYIHEVRIDRAKRLLLTESRPLASIASEVGYSSYRHFHRSFSKLCGTSPLRFAREGPVPPHSSPRPKA